MAALPFLVLILAFGAAAQTTYSTRDDDGCPPALQHRPDADVTYHPGTTPDGWAVAPPDADFPAFAPGQFDGLRIDPDLPLADYTDNPAFQNNFPFGEIDLGEMEINQDGSMTFKGEALGTMDAHPSGCH